MRPVRFTPLGNIAMLFVLLVAALLAIRVNHVNAAKAASAQATSAQPANLPTETRGVTTVNGVTYPWVARHGITGEEFQAAFDDLGSQGYRPVQVSGFAFGDSARYTAVWELRGGPALQVRHGINAADYQATVDTLSSQGYRPLWVSGFTINNVPHFATIWEQSNGPAWIARHNLNNADYQAAFNDYGGQGYRLSVISGYAVGNQDYYAAIWEWRGGGAWQGRHNL
jgi:hypothetical protein